MTISTWGRIADRGSVGALHAGLVCSGRLLVAILAWYGIAASASGGEAVWGQSLAEARKLARTLNRPLLIHVEADWCGPCRRMNEEFLNDRQVRRELGENFVLVRLDSDRDRQFAKTLNVTKLPADVILTPDDRVLTRAEGYQDREEYLTGAAAMSDYWNRQRGREKNGNISKFAPLEKVAPLDFSADVKTSGKVSEKTNPRWNRRQERWRPDSFHEPFRVDGEVFGEDGPPIHEPLQKLKPFRRELRTSEK